MPHDVAWAADAGPDVRLDVGAEPGPVAVRGRDARSMCLLRESLPLPQ